MKKSIPFEQRIQLGFLISENQGEYGYVTNLAKQKKVSRWFLYVCCLALWKEILFTSTNKVKLKQEPTVLITKHKLCASAVIIYGNCHGSIEEVRSTLSSLYDSTISVGKLSMLLNSIGKDIGRGRITTTSNIGVLALDEIYESGLPILITVDPHSGYIYDMELKSSCTQKDWESHLSALSRNYKDCLFVGDRGKGLMQAAKSISYFQTDLFHAVRHFRKVLPTLEKAAFKAIKSEEKAIKSLFEYYPSINHFKDHCTYTSAIQETEAALYKHDAYEYLLKELYSGLEWINEEGIVKHLGTMQDEVTTIIDLMVELLASSRIESIVRSFKRLLPDLFTFMKLVNWSALSDAFSEKIYYQCFLLHLLWNQRANKIKSYKSKKYCLAKSTYWKERLKEGLGKKYKSVIQKTTRLLIKAVMSSSKVENINSRLRPFLADAKSQINQNRLNFIRFILNHRVYKRGRWAGKSAIEVINGYKVANNWEEALLKASATFKSLQVEATWI